MEFKCPSCGNVFDDSLGVCPACGTEVNKAADPVAFVDQMSAPAAPAEEPVMPVAEPAEPAEQPAPAPEAPSYQNVSYSYDAGQQPQPTYQQPTYQQQTYQQQTYQQSAYQNAGYQQQTYQQPTYQNAGYPQPTYQQPAGGYQGIDPNAKSKLVAGLLGIFLGALGVHNFYLGYTGKAVAQLLITILSCGALAVISAIWGLIEGILILAGSSITTDASGRPLTD